MNLESMLEDGLLVLIACHIAVWILLMGVCVLGFNLRHSGWLW